MSVDVHRDYKEKFAGFVECNSVPNILVYGPSGSGKRSLVHQFLSLVYTKIGADNVLYVDCVSSKGINFVRDELKYFAKTNTTSCQFKSVVLLAIDRLTIDAQSALRRCIELYNHKTRFFAVVDTKATIINPLLSRFCEMRLNYPVIDGVRVNMHYYTRKRCDNIETCDRYVDELVRKYCADVLALVAEGRATLDGAFDGAERLYDNGVAAIDLLDHLKRNGVAECGMDAYFLNQLVAYFEKNRLSIKSDKMLLFQLTYFGLIRRSLFLDNIADK